MKKKKPKRKKRQRQITERQHYYRELVAHVIEKYYDVTIELSKDSEVLLPNVRIDMVFDIPKNNLLQSKETPFPYLAEVNLFHIKAVNDRLTKEDVIQYLGELYIIATSARAKGKSVALTILSAEKTVPSIIDGLQARIEKTENPWIYKIEAEVPAYIFTLEGLPQTKEYQCFLPFQSLPVLQSAKQELQKVANQKPATKENAMLLFWLRKLQPDLYKEIDMPRDMMEVIETLYPEALQKKKNEGTKEAIIKVLQARFGNVSEDVKEKLDLINTTEALDILVNGAVNERNLDDFKRLLK